MKKVSLKSLMFSLLSISFLLNLTSCNKQHDLVSEFVISEDVTSTNLINTDQITDSKELTEQE
ncbi:hypothetical protein J8L85_06990 [Maribacter sp. MMG018]|uniref:hypothetical protein n=1 Tax=Maribacter sp. MMG018 TaxID=2822688 RepID=UPI001B36484D|nr:hypothetical protein [Maribacter sp. MMG018]MBQ4914175.1 hypothetical protein [Maribacter sp. MMG018]